MEPLIRVEDLHKIYNPGENEVRALDGITLEIERGEFVAIVRIREIYSYEHARLSGYSYDGELFSRRAGRIPDV